MTSRIDLWTLARSVGDVRSLLLQGSLSLSTLLLLASGAGGQSIKINAPLPLARGGLIEGVRSSPDGEFVLYLGAGLDGSGAPGSFLFSVDSDGKHAPVRLGGPMAPLHFSCPNCGPGYGPSVEQIYRSAPRGNRVVYVADEDRDGSFELRAIPIDGSAPSSMLGGPLGDRENAFELSPDGTRVVYRRELSPGWIEIYSAPLDGSTPAVRLDGPMPDVFDVAFTPDGSQCLYRVVRDDGWNLEIAMAEVDGSQPPRRLDLPLAADRGVVSFLVSPIGPRVVYVADQEEDDRYELFSVPLAGGTPQKLNGPLVADGDVIPDYWSGPMELSPDGRWVVYTADQELDERFELYGAAVDGSEPARRLSPAHLSVIQPPRITQDSTHVLFLTDDRVQFQWELFSVPIDGSRPATRLNGPLVLGDVGAFRESVDSRRVVYQANPEEDESSELFSVPIDGGAAPIRLDENSSTEGYVYDFWVLRDGVVYQGQEDLYLASVDGDDPVREILEGRVEDPQPALSPYPPGRDFGRMLFFRPEGLYSVATADGAQAIALHELPIVGHAGDVISFQIAPGSGRVAYDAGVDWLDDHELFSVRAAERPAAVDYGLARAYRVSPDGTRMIFVAGDALLSAPIDGSSLPVRLNGPMVAGGGIASFWITLDAGRVIYLADSVVDQAFELFGVPIDGSSAAVSLTAELTVSLEGVQLSPDGTFVYFLSEPAGTRRNDLYRAPTDGSSAPVRICQGVNLRTIQPDFRLSADGNWVVFRADLTERFVMDLFVAPTDGSREPLQLNPSTDIDGDVIDCAIDSGGHWVVYRSNQRVYGQVEVFSVPLDGSAPAKRLNRNLIPGGDVLDYQLSPDGNWVAFRANQTIDTAGELYGAPIDGRFPAVKVRGALDTGGVSAFAFSADSSNLVYVADQDQRGVRELYRIDLQRRARIAKVSRRLTPEGSVHSFQISPDSNRVVFTAERNASGALTLLEASLRFSEKAAEIAGPFRNAGSSVREFQIASDGGVIYRADQDELGTTELYSSSITRYAVRQE